MSLMQFLDPLGFLRVASWHTQPQMARVLEGLTTLLPSKRLSNADCSISDISPTNISGEKFRRGAGAGFIWPCMKATPCNARAESWIWTLFSPVTWWCTLQKNLNRCHFHFWSFFLAKGLQGIGCGHQSWSIWSVNYPQKVTFWTPKNGWFGSILFLLQGGHFFRFSAISFQEVYI